MKKNIVKLLILFVVGLILSFFIWTSFYYKADADSIKILKENNYNVSSNEIAMINENSEVGIIFYPGAKVEYIAYLPILSLLDEYNIFLEKMPFNLAFFDYNRANKVIENNPQITSWYVMGHSLGGAMANLYASKNENKIDGLILLGAYIYKQYDQAKTLTIYGEYNIKIKDKLDYNINIIEIKGGNHANFGNYGKQKGDVDAQIPRDIQQKIAAEEIIKFINSNIK